MTEAQLRDMNLKDKTFERDFTFGMTQPGQEERRPESMIVELDVLSVRLTLHMLIIPV